MSYLATPDDLIYILATDGDRFSAEERRVLEDQISHSVDLRDDDDSAPAGCPVMRSWANRWVELGGNEGQPLTSSVLPPVPSDGKTMDPDFAAICVECRSNEPCCFINGTVSDSSDDSRKITWPPERIAGGPEPIYATRLLVIAKEMEGAYLTANVKTEWGGQRCQVGHLNRPRLETTGLVDGRQRIEEQQAEVAMGYYQYINTTMALKKYVPENVLNALFAMDAMLAIASTLKGSEGASFTPTQCLTDPAMGMALQVIPVPYVSLKGKLELASHIGFTTAGVTASAEARGDLTGKFASYEISAEGTAGGSANTGQAADRESTAPGLVGMMARIIGTLDHYVSEGNEQRQPLDRTKYASGARLTKSLTLESEGIELEAKTSSPDLQFSIASLSTVFSIGVSGKLDFIDALAMAFSGPGHKAIQEARARMAAGEHISATLDAYLEMAATGSLTHSIDSGASITIPANGSLEGANEAIQQEIGGKIEIKARAELAIEVEAEAWIFSARAGASGSLHTSWCWAVEKRDGERQRSYEFEGVVLTLRAYVEIEIDNSDDDNVEQKGPDLSGIAEVQITDLFKHAEEHINDSREKAEEIARQREDPPQGRGTYIIWEPKEPQWQAY
ncbi:hypothetical protein [Halomonas sp.]|uniref:hypothetical protein n=1 Tax=Halomonas sp. TaxID=1486246 RepID=UPI003F902FCC